LTQEVTAVVPAKLPVFVGSRRDVSVSS